MVSLSFPLQSSQVLPNPHWDAFVFKSLCVFLISSVRGWGIEKDSGYENVESRLFTYCSKKDWSRAVVDLYHILKLPTLIQVSIPLKQCNTSGGLVWDVVQDVHVY